MQNCILWPDRSHALLIGPEGVENITFRNITLEDGHVALNRIHGHSQERRVQGGTVQNLRIDGRLIESAEQAGFDVNGFAEGVEFR